jgi:hypothetical protein
MSKILKHIPILFLWLSGLTLTAHQLIPHDHCINDPDSKCQAPVSESHHKPGFPAHCHAFNDLILEKLRPDNISYNTQVNFAAFAIVTENGHFKMQVTGESRFDFEKSVYHSETDKFASLRAPPSLA